MGNRFSPTAMKYSCLSTLLIVSLITLSHFGAYGQATREWEIEKFERRQRQLNKAHDSLKLIFKHRWVIGASYQQLFIPGYEKAKEDKVTGVDIAAHRNIWMLSLGYYVQEDTRVGIETGWQKTEQDHEASYDYNNGGVKIDGGGGVIMPLRIYVKKDFHQAPRLREDDSINKPHFYALGSAGIAYTKLVSVHGNTNVQLRESQYEQTPFIANLGAGVSQRIDKIVLAEFSFTYQLATNYDPAIGSVYAYSGFVLALHLGFIGNGKFKQVRNRVNAR